jgi:hypothetical protein
MDRSVIRGLGHHWNVVVAVAHVIPDVELLALSLGIKLIRLNSSAAPVTDVNVLSFPARSTFSAGNCRADDAVFTSGINRV